MRRRSIFSVSVMLIAMTQLFAAPASAGDVQNVDIRGDTISVSVSSRGIGHVLVVKSVDSPPKIIDILIKINGSDV